MATVNRGTVSFNDKSVVKGTKYYYRVVAKSDSVYSYYTPIDSVITQGVTGIKGADNGAKSFALEQNYPNPFNPSTSISYTVPASSEVMHVTLKIYNTLGKEVAVLVNKEQSAGMYLVNYNAASLPSGIYTYSFHAGSFNSTRKMILMK